MYTACTLYVVSTYTLECIQVSLFTNFSFLHIIVGSPLSLTADSVSLYNLLTNSAQIVLLLLLVFKTLCGCTTNTFKKKSKRRESNLEAGLNEQEHCTNEHNNDDTDKGTHVINSLSVEDDQQDATTDIAYTNENVSHNQIDTLERNGWRDSNESMKHPSTTELTKQTSIVYSNSQTDSV